MLMNKRPQRVLEEFVQEISFNSPTEADELVRAIDALTHALQNMSHDERKATKAIAQIARYSSRKSSALNPAERAVRTETLRGLRNRLVHGRRPSSKELKEGYDIFWRALLDGAHALDKEHLQNLLEYSLAISPSKMPSSIHNDQTRTVSAFRSIFREMPEEQKERVFQDLLIRLFSDPSFARVLEGAHVGRK